jgi:hypothetical protein
MASTNGGKYQLLEEISTDAICEFGLRVGESFRYMRAGSGVIFDGSRTKFSDRMGTMRLTALYVIAH